jgi:hypothetical protein
MPVNGKETTNGVSSGEDPNNDDNLTPPPESPISSPRANTFGDEIVVRARAMNGVQSSPLPLPSEHDDDVEMEEVDKQSLPNSNSISKSPTMSKSQSPAATPYPKRKRASVYNDLDDEKMEGSFTVEEVETPPPAVVPPSTKPRTHGLGGVKGVILGYWRESPVPDVEDKHAVIGFIDVRDRLRTRIQQHNRAQTKVVAKQWPLPPGPGGSWVTFPGVVFNPPLVNLDHNQIKEYVKIRAEALGNQETEEERATKEASAIQEAIRRVQAQPPPDTPVAPQIAYGPDIPDHALVHHRSDAKRRRIERASTGDKLARPSPAPVAAVRHMPMDNLPGTRPTKIQVGFWKGSSEEQDVDKHAVYGILGANDMFRVKVTRETRDGRSVIGNFPTGAGALWIHYDEVEFNPHLKALSRPEMKEYCRVRQFQMDQGENETDRIANETKAVYEAQQRVANSYKQDLDIGHGVTAFAAMTANSLNGGDPDADYSETPPPPKHDLQDVRPLRRAFPETREASRPRHSLPDMAELRAANRPQGGDSVDRVNAIARREIARVEAVQQRQEQRQEQRAASRDASRDSFASDSMSRLNRVWASQEGQRIKAGAEDAKVFLGIKYERKQTGPFQGKLVSQGTIISIDGEDYVEYRVLTKPSFF